MVVARVYVHLVKVLNSHLHHPHNKLIAARSWSEFHKAGNHAAPFFFPQIGLNSQINIENAHCCVPNLGQGLLQSSDFS